MSARVHDDPATLLLDGELDLTNVMSYEGQIERAAEDATAGLIVDLSGLRFIDTAGVAMLFREQARMEERGRPLAYVATPGSTASRVLAIAQVALHPSVRDAYRALRP